MLRALPLFPGSSNVQYDSFDRSARTIFEGDAAQVAFQVNEQPEALVGFYLNKLTRDGWYISDQSDNHANFHRTDSFLTGFSFQRQAPWIIVEQDQVTRLGYLTAYRVTRNGVDMTEVTLELVPDATLNIQYIR